jgi:4-amino-4-deoxy-L-arabinose transferase-like glycosyltransferase
MRIANALLGLATVMLVYGAALRAGASGRSALTASAMLVACESFAWCVGVARNDMLPAALLSLGLWLIVRGAGWARLGAGVAFGLAASAKISYAVPAAAVFLAGAWTANAAERRRQLWFGCGVAIGLVPTFVLAALAPRASLTEAIIFPASAPTQYYTEIGKAWRLGPARFGQFLIAAAIGPALIAGVEIVRRCWAEPPRWLGDPVRRTMIAAALGGVVSAGLNKPFQIFYLLPALPPLFVLTALAFGEATARGRWRLGTWALFIAAGFVPVAGWFVRAGILGIPPALDAERRSDALGNALRARHIRGPIATLAGQYVPTGYSVDPRFAAGPFLYRTRGLVAPEQAREWRIVTWDQPAILAERPPRAIVTGTYPDSQADLEARLAAQARTLGYRQATQVDGFTVWVRG